MANDTPHASKKSDRRTRPITPKRLENIARHHLTRHPTSAGNLRAVLKRRADREAARLEADQTAPPDAELSAWLDNLLDRLMTEGVLDDLRYARNKATTMAARGQSRAKIKQVLGSKRVAADIIKSVLDELSESTHFSETQSAIAFASRRGFGPFRRVEDTDERRRKELGALARAGFGYTISHAIIDAQSLEDLPE